MRLKTVRFTTFGDTGLSLQRTLVASLAACIVVHVLLSTSALLLSSAVLVRSTTVGSVLQAAPGKLSSKATFRSPETVHNHRPYQPLYRAWSTLIYPSRRLDVPPSSGTDRCVAWRQTGSCDPDGPREAFFDLPCNRKVLPGRSGYCECADRTRKALLRCEQEASPFTCRDACNGALDDAQSEGSTAGASAAEGTIRRHFDERGSVVVGGVLIERREPLPGDLSRARAANAASRRRSTRRGLQYRRLADQLNTSNSFVGGAAGCIGFRQTRGCTPFGAIEQNQRSCTALVPSGVSGYCVCSAGYHGPGVGCDHPPFTCHDACDPQMAEQFDELLLGPEKAHPEEDEGGAVVAEHNDTSVERAAAIVAAKRRDDALLTYGNGDPVRVLDHTKLNTEELAEATRLRLESHQRLSQMELLDVARREGHRLDLDAVEVGGGGPAVLGDHDAFDRSLAAAFAKVAVPSTTDVPPRPQHAE